MDREFLRKAARRIYGSNRDRKASPENIEKTRQAIKRSTGGLSELDPNHPVDQTPYGVRDNS